MNYFCYCTKTEHQQRRNFELKSLRVILLFKVIASMKILFSLFLLASFTLAFAQSDTVIAFYNRDGKVCKEDNAIKFSLQMKERDHYRKLMVDLTDNKIESIAYFTDAECKTFDGSYKELYKNGYTRTFGYYHQNKKVNAWKIWSDDGILTDSLFYIDGYINGIGLSWNKEGIVTDSLMFEKEGKGVSHGYWSNGNPSQRGAYVAGKKDGVWTYYYQTGKKCQEVNYMADSAVSYTCYDGKGNIQKENCVYEKEANFPGGEKKWQQYLGNKLGTATLPDDYYKGKIYGQIWIQFIVDIDGSIRDVKVIESVDPRLDNIALDIIKKSPKWDHAVQYNRPVKAYRKQPITFSKAQTN